MFSSLDGFSTPEEIAQRIVDIGGDCCALTDHGVVTGHLDFSKAMLDKGLKPIFGCELYHGLTKKTTFKRGERDQAHLIALAMTDVGLRNLWCLVDATSQLDHFQNVGRVFWDDIEKFNEGIMFTSACAQGLVPQGIIRGDYEAANRYLDILGDNFMIEIGTYPEGYMFGDPEDSFRIDQRMCNEALVAWAQERGVPITYGDDGHYCNPAEAPIWMADLSFKNLGEIQVGDQVVGWGSQGDHIRRLQSSTVLSISSFEAPLVKVSMKSGRTIRCTADHRWLTASWGGLPGSEYFCVPEIGRKLVHVIDPTPAIQDIQRPYADYLAGIFDGEGEGGYGRVGMSQSEKNPLVSRRIEKSLNALGFQWWSGYEARAGHDMNRYYLKGGRQGFVDFANLVRPAQMHKIIEPALTTRWRNPDPIIAIEPDGSDVVYGLTTTTGNYVAWGYASKNSHPWQWEFHDIYVARQTGESMYTPIDERTMWHPEDALVIKDEAMVRESLSYLHPSLVDEALDNARIIAERADAKLPEVRRHLPMFVPSDCPWLDEPLKKLSAEELFIELVERGIVNRYGADASKEVWKRTLYEVETLLNDGIHHYFLMGWDEIQIAKALGIERGPGRGSSAGCIAAYALDITDVDPLHYGLIFERFWNSGRAKGFPDIDTDFSRARRQEIIAALKERWGEENVAAIGTTGYLKPKATIDKMAKACGIDFKEAEVLKEIVGKTTKIEILGHEQIGWNPKLEPGKKYYVATDCGDAIEEWCKADKKREEIRRYFIKVCETCCSRVAQYGIHASGIVISDTPINEELPTYRRGGKKGMPATMFSMEDVDNRMFVKLDVLGLRTLDVLEYWRDAMGEKGIEIKWSGLDKEEHPQEMWDMLAQGYTAGIFQVEDGYGKQLCKALNPSSLLDLSAIGALNRPGPIQAKIPEEYIARHNGIHPVTFIHPRFQELMEDALDETYGLFVYQEQIIAYFNRLNYTLGESDAIRKIMGKKKPEQMDGVRDGLDEWEGRGYLDMAVESGIPRDIAGRVWEDLEGFADYCFNKSHTVAYGIIGFRALFAKYYGAAEFYAACIRSLDPSTDAEKRTDMMPQFINECRRQGIAVSPPDIYYSRGYPHVSSEGVLYFGFADIAGVRSSGDYIAELRDVEGLNVESADAFRKDFDLYNDVWASLKKEKVASGEWDTKVRSPKQQLQANKLDALENVGAWFGVTGCPISMTQRQALEDELLGVILTDNTQEVFDRNEQEISHLDSYTDLNVPFADKLEEYEIDPDDSKAYIEYTIPGVVVGVQEKRTRKDNKAFGIVTVEFGSDTAEFAVWSNKWKSHKFLFRMRTPGIFTLQHRPKNEYGESYNFVKGTKLS